MDQAQVQALIVRLMGDNTQFMNTLQGAQRQALYFTQQMNAQGRWIFRGWNGHIISANEATARWAQLSMMRVQAVTAQWNQYGQVLRRVGDGMMRVGKQLTIYLTLPLTALAGVSTKAFMDFEHSFAGVAKTVDGTKEQLKGLSDSLRQMAKEAPVSVHTLAEIASMAGRLGIDLPNIEKFTKVIAGLSVSTNLSPEEASTELARFMNIMGTAQTNIDRVGSALVSLGNNFATTEKWVTDFAVRTAGAAKQAGLTESEVLGLSAALSSVGVEAEAGGTAVQKLLLKIVTAIGTSSDELYKFAEISGMTAQEFATSWSADAGDTLIKLFEGFTKAGTGAINMLDELGIKDARQIRAVLSLAAAEGVLSEAIQNSTEAYAENSALTKEVETFYNTLWGAVGRLKNRLYDIAITIGEGLKPVLDSLIVVVSSVIGWVENLANWFKELGAGGKIATLLIAGLVAAIPVLTVSLGSLLVLLASTAAAANYLALNLAGATLALNAFYAASGLIVVTLVAAGAAILYNMIPAVQEMNEEVLRSEKILDKWKESLANMANDELADFADIPIKDRGKAIEAAMKSTQDALDKSIADVQAKKDELARNIVATTGDPNILSIGITRDGWISSALGTNDTAALEEMMGIEQARAEQLKKELDNLRHAYEQWEKDKKRDTKIKIEVETEDMMKARSDIDDFLDDLQDQINTFDMDSLAKSIYEMRKTADEAGVQLNDTQESLLRKLEQELRYKEEIAKLEEERAKAFDAMEGKAKSLIESSRSEAQKLADELKELDNIYANTVPQFIDGQWRQIDMSQQEYARAALKLMQDFEGDPNQEKSKQSVVRSAQTSLMGSKEQLIAARGGNVYESKDYMKSTAEGIAKLNAQEKLSYAAAKDYYTKMTKPEPPVKF